MIDGLLHKNPADCGPIYQAHVYGSMAALRIAGVLNRRPFGDEIRSLFVIGKAANSRYCDYCVKGSVRTVVWRNSGFPALRIGGLSFTIVAPSMNQLGYAVLCCH